MSQAKVSVIMGIYNCEKTLAAAIDSIVAQTYSNWELIMCDDGSSDNSYQIAKKYKENYPEKIILLKNEINQGLNTTLNNCLNSAKGELVARQDADDISIPIRFEKQVAYLSKNPDCAFVGCGMYVNNGIRRVGIRIPSEVKPDKKSFLFSNPFFHATIVIHREALKMVGGYTEDPRLLRVEDYNLWTKLYAAGMYGENMQEAYYEVLEDDSTYKRRRFKDRINSAYATLIAVDMLRLPRWYKIYAVRGIIIGFIPKTIYAHLQKRRLSHFSRDSNHKK